MSEKITAIYVNAMKKYFLCIYMYKPENLPAFIHISQFFFFFKFAFTYLTVLRKIKFLPRFSLLLSIPSTVFLLLLLIFLRIYKRVHTYHSSLYRLRMEAAMDEQANQAQAEEPQPQSRGGGEEEEEEPRNEELIAKAQKLMEKINSLPENPSPLVLHSLTSLLETQESRYGFFFLLLLFLFFLNF
jgi:hypothetical protein